MEESDCAEMLPFQRVAKALLVWAAKQTEILVSAQSLMKLWHRCRGCCGISSGWKCLVFYLTSEQKLPSLTATALRMRPLEIPTLLIVRIWRQIIPRSLLNHFQSTRCAGSSQRHVAESDGPLLSLIVSVLVVLEDKGAVSQVV